MRKCTLISMQPRANNNKSLYNIYNIQKWEMKSGPTSNYMEMKTGSVKFNWPFKEWRYVVCHYYYIFLFF